VTLDIETADASSIVTAFVDAWNGHARSGFDGLFTETAFWVSVAESRMLGRRAIVDDFDEIHTTWAATTTVVASDIEIVPIASDVSVALFHARYLDEGGEVIPNVDRAMLLVGVRHADGWKVAGGQVTKESR